MRRVSDIEVTVAEKQSISDTVSIEYEHKHEREA